MYSSARMGVCCLGAVLLTPRMSSEDDFTGNIVGRGRDDCCALSYATCQSDAMGAVHHRPGRESKCQKLASQYQRLSQHGSWLAQSSPVSTVFERKVRFKGEELGVEDRIDSPRALANGVRLSVSSDKTSKASHCLAKECASTNCFSRLKYSTRHFCEFRL